MYVYVDAPAPGPPSDTVGADGRFALSFGLGPIDIGPHTICVQAPVVVCAKFNVTAFQPNLTLQPNSGEPERSFTIIGAGFPPYEVVALYVDSPEQLLSTPGPVADSTGGFTTGAVMRFAGSGQHQVCGDTGGPAGTQQFVVKKCATYTVLGPASGPVSPSPTGTAASSPGSVSTHSAANLKSGPPMLPIAGGAALLILLGVGGFLWLRRRRRSTQETPM